MTREEAIKELSYIADEMPSMECADWIKAISMGIKALAQEPCTDVISREAALKCFTLNNTKADAWNNIKALLPVTLQPKTGHWEWEQEPFTKNWGNWRCSECRELITVCETEWAEINKPDYKYCPNCGAKMKSEE